MKSFIGSTSIGALAAALALGVTPGMAQEPLDGDVHAIIGSMDEVLRNDGNRSRDEIERGIDALNDSLGSAVFGGPYEDLPMSPDGADADLYEAVSPDFGDVDGAVSSANDGSGTDEPDMGICGAGGEPAWCLDQEPWAGDDAAVSGFNDGTGADEPDMGICDAGGMPAWCLEDETWDIDDDVAVNSNDGGGTDEPDMTICALGGEPAWCVEGG